MSALDPSKELGRFRDALSFCISSRVSVLSFDDSPIVRFKHPPLTAVDTSRRSALKSVLDRGSSKAMPHYVPAHQTTVPNSSTLSSLRDTSASTTGRCEPLRRTPVAETSTISAVILSRSVLTTAGSASFSRAAMRRATALGFAAAPCLSPAPCRRGFGASGKARRMATGAGHFCDRRRAFNLGGLRFSGAGLIRLLPVHGSRCH